MSSRRWRAVWSCSGSTPTTRPQLGPVARRTKMSPEPVRACTTTVSSPSAGPADDSRPLLTTPDDVTRSSRAAVPSGMPTSTSPLLVCAVNAPLTALATATDPDAVCVLTLPCSRPIVIPPLAAWNFRSPSSSPIVASPEAVEMDALPSTRCTATSPEAVSALMFPSRASSATSPLADENRQSASRPSPWTSADADEACSRDLTGSAMSISTAPPRPSEMYFLPAATVSVPFLKSTRACSAARTSEAREGSRGRTSTTVSSRSVATSRTDPATTSTTAVMGSGVWKVGIDFSCRLDVSGPSR